MQLHGSRRKVRPPAVFDEPTTGLRPHDIPRMNGGRIVFEGTPADLVARRNTLTGEHLATYVGA